MAEVGGETDVAAGRSQDVADRILRVMRDGKCFHVDVAHVKSAAGDEQTKIQLRVGDARDLVLGGAVAIDRDAGFLGDDGEAGDVVAVFVRDEDAGERFGSAIDRGETLADLPAAEPGVDEEARFSGFEIRAITGRTAAENR